MAPVRSGTGVGEPWEKGLGGLVGQAAAVKALRAAAAKPVHAYLLVGPPGTGKLQAAQAFGALLLCPNGGDDGCGTCRRVAEGTHPDFTVVQREGAALSIDQAREVARLAARSSVEGGRVVIVLPDLHLAGDAVPALLKTIEEPAGDVVFIGLADHVPASLVTIASRCSQVELRPLGDEEVAGALEAEGVPAEQAAAVARIAGGRLDRARLLASDPSAEKRRQAWEAVPGRLDGSGATVAVLVDELLELLKESAAPLVARQEAELAALAARTSADVAGVPARLAQSFGRGAARELEERHRREQRRQRVDELRTGLGALSFAYRQRAAEGRVRPELAAEAVALVDGLSADLAFNPGEQLALQALMVRLDRLGRA
jgi:DNA polymerase-3 subunit delta'